MRHKIIIICLFVAFGLIGFMAGTLVASNKAENERHMLVAVAWGDGKYGPAFYGAYVYIVPESSGGYSVRATITIGRSNPYYRDCGVIDTVASPEKAVARWGKIHWEADGLHIGNGPHHYFLPRSVVERHR